MFLLTNTMKETIWEIFLRGKQWRENGGYWMLQPMSVAAGPLWKIKQFFPRSGEKRGKRRNTWERKRAQGKAVLRWRRSCWGASQVYLWRNLFSFSSSLSLHLSIRRALDFSCFYFALGIFTFIPPRSPFLERNTWAHPFGRYSIVFLLFFFTEKKVLIFWGRGCHLTFKIGISVAFKSMSHTFHLVLI